MAQYFPTTENKQSSFNGFYGEIGSKPREEGDKLFYRVFKGKKLFKRIH